MNYDIIINNKHEKIGVGTFDRISANDFARKFAIDIENVYRGNFKRSRNMLRKANSGETYTYSSQFGPMDMMLLVPLSDLGNETSYLYTNKNGEVIFYPTDYHAKSGGVNLANCQEIPLFMAVQLAGLKSDAPMIVAIKKALLGGE